jgi:2-oxoisovalerate dehydrogenase E1 component alpha subunit
VDGNDIFAVRQATKEARRMALSAGGKPILIEAMSYRVSHHSTSDDSFAYRARVEVEDWKRRDNPLTRLRKWMENRGIWDDEKEREVRLSTRKEVLDAFSKAEKEKRAALGEMFTDVYASVTNDCTNDRTELKRILETYPEEYDVEEFEGGKDGL